MKTLQSHFWLLVATTFIIGCTGESGVLKNKIELQNDVLKPDTTCEEKPDQNREPFRFEDIWDRQYRPKGFDGSWIGGHSVFAYKNANGSAYQYDAVTDTQTLLVDRDIFTQLNIFRYYSSEDLDYVLLAYEYKRVWRHSFTAKYKILERSSGELLDFPRGDLGGEVIQYARWGPNGHSLAFVYGNNLYYQSSPTTAPIQITTDGAPETKFNGIPDWLYEEDVLTVGEAHYWSPDAQRMVFATFDTRQVPRQQWPLYGEKSNIYPELVEIAYPKAGDLRDGDIGPNTVVELFVVDLADVESESPRKIFPPEELASGDYYYTRVTWRTVNSVFVNWVNRVQNRSVAVICDITTEPITCSKHRDFTQSGGWIDSPAPRPHFIDDGATYITSLQDPGSENLHRQLTLVTSPDEGEGVVVFRTTDSQEVMSVVGYDQEKRLMYFITTNGDPTERHLFRVGTPAADPEDREARCLTCDLGDDCRYVTATFSADGKHYLLTCRGPGVPVYRLRSTENEEKDVILQNNDDFREAIATKDMPTREFLELDLIGGYKGWAEIFYPPNFNSSRRYPLLVYTYGGPASQRVVKTLPMGSTISNWLRYLSSYHGVVVASVDGRGSLARGDKYLFEIYRKLGVIEIEDQIEGGREFQKMPFINTELRSAIFGWSYGGHTASHVIGDSTDVFTCGIAVAPVIAKIFYDTAYTERYLAFATEDDNAEGYRNEDVTNKAANFKDKHYLIAHGTADDNVHLMNMAHMVQALIDADVQFRQLMYVDANHYIDQPTSSRHLFRALTEFLLNDCWEGEVGRS